MVLQDHLRKVEQSTQIEEEETYQIQILINRVKRMNSGLDENLRSFKERRMLGQKLNELQQKRAWLLYERQVKTLNEIKTDYDNAIQLFEQKERELTKFNKLKMKIEGDMKSLEKKFFETQKTEARKKRILEDAVLMAERRFLKMEDFQFVLELRQQEEESKKGELLTSKERIDKLRNRLNAINKSLETQTEVNNINEEVEENIREFKCHESNLQRLKTKLVKEEWNIKEDFRNLNRELESFGRVRAIRLDYLKTKEPDVYRAVKWLEKNRGLFQSYIFNPIVLELDIPDVKMAKYVEASIPYKDLLSFTCTNSGDLDLFVEKLRAERNLNVSVIFMDDNDKTPFIPHISLEHLRSFGFHSYVNDMVIGPRTIIRFLCKTHKLHCIPIGNKYVAANCDLLPVCVSHFFSDTHQFSSKFSQYTSERVISLKPVKEAKLFTEAMNIKLFHLLIERKIAAEDLLINKQIEVDKVENELSKIRESVAEERGKAEEAVKIHEDRRQTQVVLDNCITKQRILQEALKSPIQIEEESIKERQKLQDDVLKGLYDVKIAFERVEKSRFSARKVQLRMETRNMMKKQLRHQITRHFMEIQRKKGLLNNIKKSEAVIEERCDSVKTRALKLTENIGVEDPKFRKFETIFAWLPNTIEDINNEIEKTITELKSIPDRNPRFINR